VCARAGAPARSKCAVRLEDEDSIRIALAVERDIPVIKIDVPDV